MVQEESSAFWPGCGPDHSIGAFRPWTHVLVGFEAFEPVRLVPCDPGTIPSRSSEQCERWGCVVVGRLLCALGHQTLKSTHIRVTVPALWN